MSKIGPEPLSYDERLAQFDSVPLFMKSLPEGDTDDPALAALQALIHEGTPDGTYIIVCWYKFS
jgi:hypothetical protein